MVNLSSLKGVSQLVYIQFTFRKPLYWGTGSPTLALEFFLSCTFYIFPSNCLDDSTNELMNRSIVEAGQMCKTENTLGNRVLGNKMAKFFMLNF